MADALIIPVAVGLVMGVILIAIFATIFPLPRVSHPRDIVVIVPVVIIPKGSSLESSEYNNFEPEIVKVVIGRNNTVRWVNQDTVPSRIVADNNDDPQFFNATEENVNSLLMPGDTFEFTFTKPGIIGYHSVPHPWMHGMVIVLENTQEISEKEAAQMPSPEEEAAEVIAESTDGGDGTEAREIAVYALLASDPRLAKYREGIYGHAEDFTPLRKEPSGAWIDEAVMHVIKEQIVEGDWQTAYNVTYRGLTDVKMEIRSAREILSIKEIPLPDRSYQYAFNEQDKEIIRAALDNITVRQTLESKEELGYPTFVTVVAYNGYFASSETLCPPGKCGRVHFQAEDTKQVMIIWLNTDTRVVARIDLSMEWKQDCQQYACKES